MERYIVLDFCQPADALAGQRVLVCVDERLKIAAAAVGFSVSP